MMIGKKKISKRELAKTGGRVSVGVVKFKEIPCGGDAHIGVNAIPSWGVYLFMDAGDDVEIGFDYDGCEELVRQLREPLGRPVSRRKHWDMVGDTMLVPWCDRYKSEDSLGSLLVQRCQRFVRLTVSFERSLEEADFDLIMDADAAKQLVRLIGQATSRGYRNPKWSSTG